MTEESRHAERVLNVGPGPPDDGKERRVDTCPDCGAERWEILVVPDVFHCDHCKKGTVGPNTVVREREPEQIDLFGATVEPAALLDPKARATAERARDVLDQAVGEAPPIDEADAWMADEMPDE